MTRKLFNCFSIFLLVLHHVFTAPAQDDFAIDIGLRPEGITEGPTESTVFVSEYFAGGIKKVDIDTKQVIQVVSRPGFHRLAGGLYYDAANNLIFAAGLWQRRVYVYDPDTGETRANCFGGKDFLVLNGVTALNGYVYVTDSITSRLLKMEIDAASRGECVVSSIPLPQDIFKAGLPDILKANGIAAYGNGLVIAVSVKGGLYYLDLSNNNAVTELVSPDDTGLLDGIAIAPDNLLYAMEFDTDRVLVYEMATSKASAVSAEFVGIITSDLFNSPASAAVRGDKLAVTNLLKGWALPFRLAVVDRFEMV